MRKLCKRHTEPIFVSLPWKNNDLVGCDVGLLVIVCGSKPFLFFKEKRARNGGFQLWILIVSMKDSFILKRLLFIYYSCYRFAFESIVILSSATGKIMDQIWWGGATFSWTPTVPFGLAPWRKLNAFSNYRFFFFFKKVLAITDYTH